MVRSHKGGMAKKRVRPFVLFFHRRAAPARCAAIPTWRRRWAVGAFGARPDAYILRRTEAALVPYNGLCHSHKRQGSVINACAQQGTVLCVCDSLISVPLVFCLSNTVDFFVVPASRPPLRSVHEAIDGQLHCFDPWQRGNRGEREERRRKAPCCSATLHRNSFR